MSAPVDAVPRDYNFAADILKRNLDAGRGEKVAYIDPRGSWTYRDLAARVDSFGRALRALDIAARSAFSSACSTASIGRPPSSARSRPAWSRFPSTRC